MSSKSFANRLSWKIIGVVLVIFVFAILMVAVVSDRIIADEATRSTQHILHGTISEIEKPLNEVEVSTYTVAAYMSSMKDNPEMLQRIAHRTVEVQKLINGCGILFLDEEGRPDLSRQSAFSYMDGTEVLDYHANAQDLQILADLWATQPVETKTPCWTAPYSAFDSGDNLISTYSYPLVDSTLSVYAVVVAGLSVDWMEQKVEELRPYKNSLTTLLCGDSTLIGLRDTVLIRHYAEQYADDESFSDFIEDLKKGKDSIRRRVGRGNEASFVVYGSLHNGWNLSILCPYRDVLHRNAQMHLNLAIIGLIGLALLFFMCRRVIRKTTRPITELSESALHMAKGDFKAQLPEITSEDEMRTLHDSFVFLQNSIADYIEDLKTTTSANERMESELNVARNIQMGMLSTDFPPQVYAVLNPAKEVGGDLYDFVLKGDQLYFAVGDVSGKGVPASLMMAITRASLRFVAGLNLTMSETLSRINNGVSESNSNYMFVTLFVGRVDLKTGHMEYCNAGHNPLLIIPPDGEPFFLKAKPNLAIGLKEDFPYEDESIDLKPGTRIIAYTDGVTEAEKGDKSLFGNDRLVEWSRSIAGQNLSEKEVVESLLASLKVFVNRNPQNDDITIMSLQVKD